MADVRREILLWLKDNPDIPLDTQIESIKAYLIERNVSHADLLHYAACSFTTLAALVALNAKHADGVPAMMRGVAEMAQRAEGRKRSKAGRRAADARHAQPGGAKDRIEKIRAAWSTGKYTSRDDCAEREYSALGFGSFKAARRALSGTPVPTEHPTAP
jgi:hypothetical protein